jgi:sterol desaturase/sphingolipid hydroxylase (fatty acid hydroxylase superfamily)
VKAVWIAAPILLLLVIVEWLASRRADRRSGDWRDSLGNIGCGALEQAAGKLIYPVLFAAYIWLEQYAVVATPWVVSFLLGDLAFYTFHRAAHRVPVIWATHCVHHASSAMNYTVAMRNGAIQRVFAVWFYLPLALIGVPSSHLLVVIVAQILYQFVLHTRFGSDFGPLGWILATPSHHRVHHGREPHYRDRNFGAVLIVWDRLFGTFTPEADEPTYGVDDARLRSSNPLRANLVGWFALRHSSESRSESAPP